MTAKVYVDVLAVFSREGELIPTAFVWEDGRKYAIDKVSKPERCASRKAGGTGYRYTCQVGGKICHLTYEENYKWFMPFVNKLETLIKNLTIQCVRLKEEVIQLREEKKRLSDDVEFYKGKIKDMSDRTELLQEKADDLERVKRYAGAGQIDTIIRKVKEQERTEQQIRRYDRSYGTR